VQLEGLGQLKNPMESNPRPSLDTNSADKKSRCLGQEDDMKTAWTIMKTLGTYIRIHSVFRNK
jgi:hypothetical protein